MPPVPRTMSPTRASNIQMWKYGRKIRHQRHRILIAEKLNDKEQLQTAQIKMIRLQEEYVRFSKAADLPVDYARMEVTGFNWKQAKAAETVASDPFKNPPKDLQELSEKVDKALDAYAEQKSKWSGKNVVLSREQMPKANGRKGWNCDISLRDNVGIKTVVHEHLHARSVSYFGEAAYVQNQNAEEGTVNSLPRKYVIKTA